MNNVPNRLYKHSKQKAFRLTPAKFILFGFSLIILIGAFLLCLPQSQADGYNISFTDSLFTSVSSVCVTGLVIVDTNIAWSFFGKTVILLLIQIGALGIMSVVTIFSVFAGKKLGLLDRLTIQESLNNFTFGGVLKTFKSIFIVTMIIEAIGAFLFFIEFLPIYGIKLGLINSVFHSVSSFCNAGFDIFGSESNQFTSLLTFNDSYLTVLTTALLIIVGGLGFIVWNDVAKNRKFSKLMLHSKIVLTTSGCLLLIGTIGFFIFELHNPMTLQNMPIQDKLLNSFFQSVTTRTAGFSTILPSEMTEISNFFTILLMFIGGAPGSTAGGIKVTTFTITILTVISYAKNRDEVQIFERRLPQGIIKKVVAVVAMAMLIVIASTLILLYNENISFMQALYESVSAFGNVGLSTGITPQLSTASKYALMASMLLGRVGPITAIVAIISTGKDKKLHYRYPEGKITVG